MFYKLYWKFIKKNWKLYIIYFIILLSIPLSNTVVPHYYGEIINSLKKGDFVKSKALFLILLSVWIIIQIFNLTNSYLNTYLMPKFQSFIRQYFFNKIIDSYSENFKELELGHIISKIIRSPGIIQNIFIEIRDFVFENMLIVISNIIYLSSHHPRLGFMFFISVVFIYILSYFYYNSCHGFIKNTEEAYDNVHEQIQDTLTNLLSIYTCQKSDSEKDRVKEYNKTTSNSQIATGNCNNKFRIIFSILYVIIFLGLNYTAYNLYQKGEVKLNGLVSIFIINYAIFNKLSTFYYDAHSFMNVYTKVEHITKFIESMPIKPKNNKGTKLKLGDKYLIEFKGVGFKPEGSDKWIYDGLNLKIKSGEALAIMGSIGSGKSTCVKLLVRLLHYQKGSIMIDGIKVDDLDIEDLRKNIIYVPQHPILFNRTLWENISYGLEDNITEDDIYKILHKSGLNDLESVYREKMHQKVGKLGSNLSGGQKQVVWLIRCLLKKSKVIILDEPTSALDEKSRRNVEKLISKLAETSTLIIITHDKELLQLMDRMIYFDKGKIIKDVYLNDVRRSDDSDNSKNSNKKKLQ
jgi:ABC-type multidrug transport system fused ATPase/permease subunit